MSEHSEATFAESGPRKGQLWDDRGTVSIVWSVADDGAAVMLLPSGEKLPVRPSFFSRARLVRDAK